MLMILQFWHLPVACCFSSNWVWPGNFHSKIFTEDSFYASSTWQDLGPDTAVICCEQIIIATYRTFWSIWKEYRENPSVWCSVRAMRDQCVGQVNESLAPCWVGSQVILAEETCHPLSKLHMACWVRGGSSKANGDSLPFVCSGSREERGNWKKEFMHATSTGKQRNCVIKMAV